MKAKKILVAALLLLSTSFTAVYAQKPETRVEKRKSLIGDYLSIGGRIDAQYTYDYFKNNMDVEEISNTFNVRRARLDVKGNISKHLEFRVQAEFASSPKLLDAYVAVKINPWLNFKIGQQKLPFTIENPYSLNDLEVIEYAQVVNKLSGFSDISGVSSYGGGRDVGLIAYGSLFNREENGKKYDILGYTVGFYNGNGINKKDNNEFKDFAARLDFHPFMKDLMITGAAYVGAYSLINDSLDGDRQRYTFGAQYKNEKLTVRSEYIYGITDRLDMTQPGWITTQKSDGIYVMATYYFTVKGKKEGAQVQKIAPVLRYDYMNNDINLDNQRSTYYMVGVNYYPMKHLRLQLDYTLKTAQANDNNGHMVAALVSVNF